jgi:hypothetical protein
MSNDKLTEIPSYDAKAAIHAARDYREALADVHQMASPRRPDFDGKVRNARPEDWAEVRDRIVRRRAGDDDPAHAIERAARLVDRAELVLLRAVALERARGCSWQTIGDELGISRQAAHERFAHRLGSGAD